MQFQSILLAAVNYKDMFRALQKIVMTSTGLSPNAKRNFQDEVETEINWAKQTLKKQDRIVWYLRWFRLWYTQEWDSLQTNSNYSEQPDETFAKQVKALAGRYEKEMARYGNSQFNIKNARGLRQELTHLLSIDYVKLQSVVFNEQLPEALIAQLYKLEEEYNTQEKGLIKPQQEDQELIKFPNGWAWWLLPRASCSDEAKAMGHCGNSPQSGNANLQILSLREPKQSPNGTAKWEPHLTFIYNKNGYLGEMKGKGNQKPAPQYHPYIVKLLEDPMIKGLVGGGYLAKNNFGMKDLSQELYEELAKKRPDLAPGANTPADKKRIIAILGLAVDAWDEPTNSFAVEKWETGVAFLGSEGGQYVQQMASFVRDEDEPDAPSVSDLMDLVDDYEGRSWNTSQSNSKYMTNLGWAMKYYYPKEIDRLFHEDDPDHHKFDPTSREDIEELLDYLNKDEREVDGDNFPNDSPVQELLYVWYSGKPNADNVKDNLDYYLDDAAEQGGGRVDGYDLTLEIEDLDSPVKLLLSHDDATALAELVSAGEVDVPDDWTKGLRLSNGDEEWDYDPDGIVSALDQYFSNRPERPVPQGQMRLFSSRFLAAPNYFDMFRAILAAVPKQWTAQQTNVVQRNVDWAKRVLKRQDRIIWFLRLLRLWIAESFYEILAEEGANPEALQKLEPIYQRIKQDMERRSGERIDYYNISNIDIFQQSLQHLMGLQIPSLQSYVFDYQNPRKLITDLEEIEREEEKKKRNTLTPRSDDRIILQFPDGWAWWLLPRAACSDEAKAMGHCGNSPANGNPDLQIMSLREPKEKGWEPHLTFIFNKRTGFLGEMKGKNNSKPTSKYHPYIIKLFEKYTPIRGLIGGGYAPERNFALSDLSKPEYESLVEARPDLAKTFNAEYVIAALGLADNAYDETEGTFVVGEWDDVIDFVHEFGHDSAICQYAQGEKEPPSPSVDELLDLLTNEDTDETDYLYNFGLALTYAFPTETRRLFGGNYLDYKFNAHDESDVRALLQSVKPDWKKPPVSTLAWIWGITQPYEEKARDVIREAFSQCIEDLPNWMRLDLPQRESVLEQKVKLKVKEAQAMEAATRVENGDADPNWGQYIRIHIDDDWESSESDGEYQSEKLDEEFGHAPERPAPEGQLKFKFPKKRKRKLKSSLLKEANHPTFPDFDEYLASYGGINLLISDMPTAESFYSDEIESDEAEVDEALENIAYHDLKGRYEQMVAVYKTWGFPLPVFREVVLNDIADLKTDGIGIFWANNIYQAREYNAYENLRRTQDDSVVLLKAFIMNPADVNWEETLLANLNPSRGEDEAEVQVFPGIKLNFVGFHVRSDGEAYRIDSEWHPHPVKTVTAARPRKEFVTLYHGTSPENVKSILKHGLQPPDSGIAMPTDFYYAAPTRVFLTRDYDLAVDYAEKRAKRPDEKDRKLLRETGFDSKGHSWNPEIAVVQIKLPRDTADKLRSDTTETRGVYLRGAIPPKYIEKIMVGKSSLFSDLSEKPPKALYPKQADDQNPLLQYPTALDLIEQEEQDDALYDSNPELAPASRLLTERLSDVRNLTVREEGRGARCDTTCYKCGSSARARACWDVGGVWVDCPLCGLLDA
jgi:hypothetical protein